MNMRFIWLCDGNGEEFSSVTSGEVTHFSSKQEALENVATFLEDNGTALSDYTVYIAEISSLTVGDLVPSGYKLHNEREM